MAKQTVDLGSSANDGTGDSIRSGGDKVNDNFTELYNALGNGTTIAANTGTLASNAYLVASYQSNTQITTRLNTYALVANVAALAALGNTNSAIATQTARVTLVNTNLTGTNTAIRLLTSDRAQVANVFSIFSSGKSYSTVPNYGAAVTYDISANSSSAYIVSNMGFGKGGAAFNNPELTVRNESTIAFDLNGLGGSHPFAIRSGSTGSSLFSNTLIHVATNGTITTGASAQGKTSGVLYWQIPHDIVSSGRDSYTYYCQSHSAMKGNVNIKDTGAI